MNKMMPVTLPEDVLDDVVTLHTRTIDAINGLSAARSKAEAEIIAPLDRLLAIHRSHAGQLNAILVSNGLTPDEDGSFMSIVHKAVIAVRSFIDRLDGDIMPQVRSGEMQMIDLYDEVLEELGERMSDQRARVLMADISSMRQELKAEVDKI